MRRGVLLLILALVLTVPQTPSSLAADVVEPGTGLSIGLVMSTSPWEALTIVASSPVGLEGWSVSDGEGSVTFTEGFLEAGEVLLLAADPMASDIVPATETLLMSDPGLTRKGRLALADGGDQVMLISPDGATVDILCYGDIPAMTPWSGPALARMGSGEAAIRIDLHEFGAGGWIISPPGRSAFEPREFQGSVEPFSCPEQALGRIMRELRYASWEVLVSVYQLDSPEITTGLCGALMRGAKVTVLLEGSPVGGIDEDALSQMATLSGYGAQVLTMHSNESYRRYDYLHCKYAVFDGQRTIVMSDNWMDSALSDDRGWGAVVDSRSMAGYMREVFMDDADGIDVTMPDLRGVEPCSLSVAQDRPAVEVVSFRASIVPILSPDNSEGSIRELMASAGSRLLMEMFYIDLAWDEGSLLDGVLDAALHGVSTRVLLDGSWFTEDDNVDVVDRINLIALERHLDMEAARESGLHGFGLLHNKGMIVDDTVLISSINWCDSALHRNREVGLMIRSAELSDRFATEFYDDWDEDPEPPVAVLPESVEANPDGAVMLNGSSCHDNDEIVRWSWDVDGDGVSDSEGMLVCLMLPPGEHVITLTVEDPHGNTANASTRVAVPATTGGVDLPLPFILLLPVASLVVWRSLKKIKNRRRDSGG